MTDMNDEPDAPAEPLAAAMPSRSASVPAPIRTLVIDLGTNSFHAVIVDAFANGSFTVLDQLKELVAFGDAGLSKHWLSEEAMERGVTALRRIHLLGQGWGVEDHLAFATSAIREARNGGDFLDRARREIGLNVRTISGEREAELIYEGVRIAVDMLEPTLIVDIGGGSCEFVVGTSRVLSFATSLKVGAARLTEQYIDTDPVSDLSVSTLRHTLALQLKQVVAQARSREVGTLVGSSGAMQNLAQVAVNRAGDPGRTIYQQPIEAGILQEVTDELIGTTRSQRLSIPGIDERRVDQIVAASLLVSELLDQIPFRRFVVSPYALREGMVVHFIHRNHERLEQLAPYGDIRRRSVNELGFKCQWEVRHARKVADLAVELFDVTAPIHELGPDERELLEHAALLHDVGYHISRSSHHKHSYYIVANADLKGFQPEEIEMIALITRYHAGSSPNPQSALGDLEAERRDAVLKLASLLRLAEGLDRSHFQNVRSLDARLEEEKLILTIETISDPEIDLWGARRGTDLFESVFGRPVEIEVAETPSKLSRQASPSV